MLSIRSLTPLEALGLLLQEVLYEHHPEMGG